jgi:hypothetical protein
MPDFTVRSDSVNVERVMEQIRARIRDKRGVDYTEQQIQELANVKLEKLLDPGGIRSDLLEQFMKMQPASQTPEATAEAVRTSKLFYSHRAPLRLIRRLLRPILKLFFNPTPVVQVLEGGAHDAQLFVLAHNLVVETTRLAIEVKNLKMTVASLTGRLEFNERRARALESVVVYKPSADDAAAPPSVPQAPRPSPPPPRNDYHRPPAPAYNRGASASSSPPSGSSPAPSAAPDSGGGDRAPQPGGAPFVQGEGPGQRSRRRRRRRGRRNGPGGPGGPPGQAPSFQGSQSGQPNLPVGDTAPAPDAPRAEPAAERAPESRPPDQGTSGHEPDSQ